jgi:glycosyltransferase involved in cell wall biosynthesis
MNNILLSVIIPAYNAEPYILSCLNSILEYRGNDLEVIVIDDGSADHTLRAARSLTDRRVTVLTQKNRGPAAARNRGIKQAQGDFLMFADADDWLEPGAVEWVAGRLREQKTETLLFNMIFWKNSREKTTVPLPLPKGYRYETRAQMTELRVRLLTTFRLNSLCDKIYSGALIRKNGILLPDGCRYGEDAIFNLKYFSFSERGKYLDRAFYNYRFNEQSLTRRFDFRTLDDLEILHRYKRNLLNTAFCKTMEKEQIKTQMNDSCCACLFSCIVNAKQNGVKNGEIAQALKDRPALREAVHTESGSRKAALQKRLIRAGQFRLLFQLYAVRQFLRRGKSE